MIIALIVYTIIILIIVFKGIYNSVPFFSSFSIEKNRETILVSIQIESFPFYLNQGKIDLFIFFINFLLISFISLSFLPEFFFNNTAYCMDAEDSDNSINPDSFILDESTIFENIEREYNIIFEKDIKYTGYLGYSNKNFSNNYNFKIFREINNEIDTLIYKKQDIFRTVSLKYNPLILDIQCENFIEILDNLNYNCHKTRFIFLKTYFDMIESKIEETRFKNWVGIFSKIDIFQKKALPIFIMNDIFNFFFDKGVCNNFNYLINFTNYLSFLINNNNFFIGELKENDPEKLLNNLNFVKNISYDYKFYNTKNKKLESNKELLTLFQISSNYLSENTEGNIPIDNLLINLFEDRLNFLSYFKEYKRSQNEVLSNNNISINKLNSIIFKNSVFFGKTDIKSYLIENNFDKNNILNSNMLSFSKNFEKTIFTTKKYFFEDEEKNKSLKKLKK